MGWSLPQSVTQVGLEANEGGVGGPSSLDPGLDPGTCAAAATAVAPQWLHSDSAQNPVTAWPQPGTSI